MNAIAPVDPSKVNISVDDLVRLAAVDNNLFATTFFPQTTRQPAASFHKELWNLLDDPTKRFLNIVAHRDSAKTSILRMFTGKRIAYNMSKTILYVGSSEAHAVRSIQWLRGRVEPKMNASGVEEPSFFAKTFALRPGVKWTDTEIEIFHGIDTTPIWLLGVGITGNIRGINFDDYRPDLIVLDDILNDENGKTKEQRDKISDLVQAALKNSLAPASERPGAKIVMLNTPQDGDDIVARAEKDPDWHTAKYSCWTKSTEDLPLDSRRSSWPERFPTAQLIQEKKNAIIANRLSIFSREKEVRIVSRENAIFVSSWLRFYEVPPATGATVLFIDPVPPPTKKNIDRKELERKDYEVIGTIRFSANNYYLLDYEANRGHTPDWTIAKFFEMIAKWQPYKAMVETVAYQATLKWILEKAMTERRRWITIEPFNDVKSKPVRIQQALHSPASEGRLWVHPTQTTFIEQFNTYPSCENDDVIDGVAIGALGLVNAHLVDSAGQIDNSNVLSIRQQRFCP